ncbi:MAG TPA: hypothetical protein VEB63_06405 [Chitinophagaceae bacterium]|nr:hypothetical protein [Chitinophagaceae bacterium]
MLTEEERSFLRYWEHNRARKKRMWWQLAAGMPLAVALITAILINVFSGWFRGATAALQMRPSLLLTVLGATLLIVVFIVVFSAKHRWDQNEQRYRELLLRERNEPPFS